MNARTHGRRRLTIGGAATLALLSAGCGPQKPAQQQQGTGSEVPVRTAAVVDTALARPVVATGALAAKEELPLGFKIGGVIASVAVEAGRDVRAGQVLATLDLREIDAEVGKAQAGADKADADLARARALYADSVVTQAVLEGAEAAQKVAANDLRIARFQRRYAEISAPSAGTVLARLADPGQVIGSGTPVLLFGAAGKGQVVKLGLADRDVVRLTPGDPADVAFGAYPGRVWTGRVARIGGAAAAGAGTYEVEIALDAPVTAPDGGPGLASGLVAEVTIRPTRTETVRLVPIAALLEGDGDRATVWSVGPDGAPRRHAVTIAFLAGDRAAVREGLAGIDRVVTDGAARLKDGSRVRPADAPAAR